MILFDFTDPQAVTLFHPIGDRVMGGVSTGTLAQEDDSAVFTGQISFENQGGFASVRSRKGPWDLKGFQGVELEVMGDGRVYKLSLTTEPRYDSVVYRVRFTPPAGQWATVKIPFSDFLPTFRGEKVPDAPPLDPATIATFGFLISDRQEGPFRLEIKTIAAY